MSRFKSMLCGDSDVDAGRDSRGDAGSTSPSLRRDGGELAGAFDAASRKYDLMVSLNPGYRAHLRRAARAVVAGIPAGLDHEAVLLDLGCGSGLSTRELAAAARERGLAARIIGVDASPGMLAHARAKTWDTDVEFVHGRGEALGALGLPAADGVLACYLLRNVPDVDATLTGIRSALRAGGILVAEDYSVADSPAAARRWALVNRAIILPLARVLTGEVELYRYLHASVDRFMGIEELTRRVQAAGFTGAEHRTVGGWQRDILHLVRGYA